MAFVELDSACVRLVGEQRDAYETRCTRKVDRILEQARAGTTTMVRVHDHVFKQANGTALGCTDGKQEVDHADDFIAVASDKNAPDLWRLDDRMQTTFLLLQVWLKVGFLGEKQAQESRKLSDVLNSGLFDQHNAGFLSPGTGTHTYSIA